MEEYLEGFVFEQQAWSECLLVANEHEVPGDPLERVCLQLRPQGSIAPGLPFWRRMKVGPYLLSVGSP